MAKKSPTTAPRKQATLATFFGSNQKLSSKSETSQTLSKDLVDTDDEIEQTASTVIAKKPVPKVSPAAEKENKDDKSTSEEVKDDAKEDVFMKASDDYVSSQKRKVGSNSSTKDDEILKPKKLKSILKAYDELVQKANESYNWALEDSGKSGVEVPYRAVTAAFSKCESITSRLAIQEIVTDLLRCALVLCNNEDKSGHMEDQVASVVYLCCNR